MEPSHARNAAMTFFANLVIVGAILLMPPNYGAAIVAPIIGTLLNAQAQSTADQVWRKDPWIRAAYVLLNLVGMPVIAFMVAAQGYVPLGVGIICTIVSGLTALAMIIEHRARVQHR